MDNAREKFLNCDILNLNKQKGVESIEKNRGSAQKRNIFMDTYVMSKELFIELIKKARKISSMYTLPQIVNESSADLDIAVFHTEDILHPLLTLTVITTQISL